MKGAYRTYLAPAAVGDLMDTIVWGGGLGEAALRQGNSALISLARGGGGVVLTSSHSVKI